ncbi:hypothetical protein B5F09_13855 [Erysipelatoclostridium sp. An173]|uniref:hypothetical protein n=1 Tax=Erysipelatoclostridium sp. An173 TaxID=1965571 RepID=UPI000B3A7F91|nr:hypothetical protein [Erysipelatoclostridium sp. An173]OUP71205.1 hypothetical protein B5F09_13855 [Erysipelatoclostridium sp. An173]
MEKKLSNLFFKNLLIERNLIPLIINQALFNGKDYIKNEDLLDIDIAFIKEEIEIMSNKIQNFDLIVKRFANQIFLLVIAKYQSDIDQDILKIYERFCYESIATKITLSDDKFKNLQPNVYTFVIIHSEPKKQLYN